MKPTQEQIDAALRYAAETDTWSDKLLLNGCNPRRTATFNALTILAPAYREAMGEIDRLKDNLKLTQVLAIDLQKIADKSEKQMNDGLDIINDLQSSLQNYRNALEDGPENCSYILYEEVDAEAANAISKALYLLNKNQSPNGQEKNYEHQNHI